MNHESAQSHHHGVGDLIEERLCGALRNLPARTPPAGLRVALRVIASRERQRFLERRTLRQVIATWRERASLSAADTMRSVVLPLAGGVSAAVILFSTWLVPTYPLLANGGVDVPTILSTDATVTETGVIGLSGGDAVVDVTVDDQGRFADYAIVSGADVLQDPNRRHRFENVLLATQFAPATDFGRPKVSKVRMVFSQVLFSHIDVKVDKD